MNQFAVSVCLSVCLSLSLSSSHILSSFSLCSLQSSLPLFFLCLCLSLAHLSACSSLTLSLCLSMSLCFCLSLSLTRCLVSFSVFSQCLSLRVSPADNLVHFHSPHNSKRSLSMNSRVVHFRVAKFPPTRPEVRDRKWFVRRRRGSWSWSAVWRRPRRSWRTAAPPRARRTDNWLWSWRGRREDLQVREREGGDKWGGFAGEGSEKGEKSKKGNGGRGIERRGRRGKLEGWGGRAGRR